MIVKVGIEAPDKGGDITPVGDDEFCRHRRGRRPDVSDKVRNRIIGLVPHGADGRDVGGEEGACDPLFVEGP